jgi:hypothetical protein
MSPSRHSVKKTECYIHFAEGIVGENREGDSCRNFLSNRVGNYIIPSWHWSTLKSDALDWVYIQLLL